MKTIRFLLENLIDYAGLFPPAELTMAEAVRNYAAYRHSEHNWMLGRFIVPASRLQEFEQAAASCWPRDGEETWMEAFRFEEGCVHWREEMLVVGHIRNARHLFSISFGSCSFTEPIEDLQRLNLF